MLFTEYDKSENANSGINPLTITDLIRENYRSSHPKLVSCFML